MTTLKFVLRAAGLPFFAGIFSLVGGIYGYRNYTPSPDPEAYDSVVGMLGTWPYIVFMILGIILIVFAWIMGANLRSGTGK